MSAPLFILLLHRILDIAWLACKPTVESVTFFWEDRTDRAPLIYYLRHPAFPDIQISLLLERSPPTGSDMPNTDIYQVIFLLSPNFQKKIILIDGLTRETKTPRRGIVGLICFKNALGR
jgi:hypothetical protein